jgi:hypothetical protein
MQAHHVCIGQARRLRRLAFIAVFAVAIAMPGLAVGGPAQATTPAAAPAGTLIPNTAGPRCTLGSSGGNVRTCIYVEGSGLHVDYAWGSIKVLNAGRSLKVCLRGPHGSIKCEPTGSSYAWRTPSDPEMFVLWQPNRNETPGDYCARTWRRNADFTATEIGDVCVNVHA